MIIREVAESNWGSDGKPISLEELRDPPKDAKALCGDVLVNRGRCTPREDIHMNVLAGQSGVP